MQTAYQPVKAEIRIPDLTSNLKVIRAQVKKPCALCAVLKADAYGHGLPGMLSLLAEKGLADMAAQICRKCVACRPIYRIARMQTSRADEFAAIQHTDLRIGRADNQNCGWFTVGSGDEYSYTMTREIAEREANREYRVVMFTVD